MKSLLLSLVMAWLGLSIVACGGASKRSDAGSYKSPVQTAATSTSTASIGRASRQLKKDRDNDGDNNDDDYGYGYAAGAVDRKEVAAVVDQYYAAAAADQGARACSLLYSVYAEVIPETYGEPPAPPALRGSTCSVVVTKFFKQNHQELAADHATLKVMAVRIRSRHALVLLSFKTMPQRTILVHREGRAWKMDQLLDTEFS